MADDYLPPEQRARYERIDPQLRAAGWEVQRFKEMNLAAAKAVAVREYPTPTGPVDYVLYIDRKLVGTIEAKKAGEKLTKVEKQTRRYAEGLEQDAQTKSLPHWRLPLPFHYTSTGFETALVDLRDPIPRPREVFTSTALTRCATGQKRPHLCEPACSSCLRSIQPGCARRGVEVQNTVSRPEIASIEFEAWFITNASARRIGGTNPPFDDYQYAPTSLQFVLASLERGFGLRQPAQRRHRCLI